MGGVGCDIVSRASLFRAISKLPLCSRVLNSFRWTALTTLESGLSVQPTRIGIYICFPVSSSSLLHTRVSTVLSKDEMYLHVTYFFLGIIVTIRTYSTRHHMYFVCTVIAMYTPGEKPPQEVSLFYRIRTSLSHRRLPEETTSDNYSVGSAGWVPAQTDARSDRASRGKTTSLCMMATIRQRNIIKKCACAARKP